MAETFIVAWRRLAEVPDDPTAWLLAVARHVLANQRRGADRRTALGERLRSTPVRRGSPDPAGEVEARMTLLDALRRLGERDREALLLVAWDGLDNRSAAVVMHCSPAEFAVRLHRARRRLMKRLHSVDLNEPDAHHTRVTEPGEIT